MKFNGVNVRVSPSAKLGANVKIGDDSSLYDHVEVGDNSIISNGCVLGEPLAAYYHDQAYVNPPLVIGAGALLRSHTIIYAGTQAGEGLQTGHRVTIRENTRLGKACRVGTLTDIQDQVIIGDHCWFHSNIFIPAGTVLGNYVFIYPGVIFTNDRMPPSAEHQGATVEEYAQVGAGAVILPGVRVGTGALIAAGAVVTRDVQPWSLMAGNPAKKIKDVREIMRKPGEYAYPWMKHFSRGMPWAGSGFDEWKAQQG